ncbi:sugar phosphate nucleotidyltransferase [Bacillus haimaensis]|uniref:mannose-1-phosphate guanylyltransferase n=1 Tax=Bacillus haimaensis TaxID=3160967 RepID=UPI003AA81FCD
MKVVIMAGGQGTRFWPWSVKERPKQFLSLMSEETMLQQTYKRFLNWLSPEKIFIITTEQYVSLVKEQIPTIDENQILIEPYLRDTGPCIAMTAQHFLSGEDNEAFAAVPADHYIPDDSLLPEVFKLAEKIAQEELNIVTLGIKPTRPETEYGYIQVESDKKNKIEDVLKVKRFIEKPKYEVAKELYQEENIFWNSGIFIWKPSTISYYLKKYQPEIWSGLQGNDNLKDRYSLLPKISVDYAILEKAENIFTIPISLEWDDVGNWSAWTRLNTSGGEGNLIQGDIHLHSSKNCVVISEVQKTVVIGVEDLIIVSTDEGLLICNKDCEKSIKDVINGFS